MKKVLFSAVLLTLTSFFAQAQTIASVSKFVTDTVDLGKIEQSHPTKGTFYIRNISKSPIIIEQANPTCGCTISDYTKTPIQPDSIGVINATYNAANLNHFEKKLTVKLAGINEIKTITLRGEVLAAADYTPWKATQDSIAAVQAAQAAAASHKKVKKVAKKKVAPASN